MPQALESWAYMYARYVQVNCISYRYHAAGPRLPLQRQSHDVPGRFIAQDVLNIYVQMAQWFGTILMLVGGN